MEIFNQQSAISNEDCARGRDMSEPGTVLNNPQQANTRERDLIFRVQRGEHELFYELVRPYERRVYAAALAILRNQHDAEDAAQEAMLKAFANIRQFRAEARFSTWLIQITVNEALMRRRRERTVQMEGIDDHRSGRGEEESDYAPRDFADWREIPSEALERKEVRQRLAEALATLDRKYREVFVLRDMEHLNIQETAEALGITVASVKTRLLRARLMLRDLLAAGWEQGWFSRLPFEKGNKPW
jgi:RNA polymerase sigma-70 factor, ECF subfamily